MSSARIHGKFLNPTVTRNHPDLVFLCSIRTTDIQFLEHCQGIYGWEQLQSLKAVASMD